MRERARHSCTSMLAGVILLATHGPAARAATPPSVETFAADVDFRAPSLSPDGKLIAYTGRVGGRRVLIVLDLEKRVSKPILAAEEASFSITWCRFKTNQRMLCGLSGVEFMGPEPYPVSRLIAVNADGSRLKILIQRGYHASSQFQDRVLDWRIADPKHVYVELSPKEGSSPFPDVYALDVDSGMLALVQKQRRPIRAWYTDQKGVLRYGEGCDDHEKCEWVARDSANAPWRALASWVNYTKSDFSVLGFGPSGDKLLVTENLEGRRAVYQLDLTGKAEKELLFANPKVDVGGVTTWPTDGRITGFHYATDRDHRELFDADAAALQKVVDMTLPGTGNQIIDSAHHDKLLLIAARTDVLPTQYYLLDLDRRSMLKMGALSSDLAQVPLAPMKSVEIKASDGTKLPGYLTLPLGAEARNLPLVVYPHGGPYARDTWGFNEVVQFMASRGYAVLQVNFRGSVGYGDDWYEAGLRKWGTVMVDDINASTRWAIDQGIADPRRTCIVGWSFGGYAALMGAIREPDLYRCVVSIAGVADLNQLRREEKRFYGGIESANYTLGSDSDELAAGSPLRATERIKAPVLLIHGTYDWQVDVDQSQRMDRALKSASKSRELITIDGGNHALSRYEWRKTLYSNLESFLAANLQGLRPTTENAGQGPASVNTKSGFVHMLRINASPNSEHFTSFAPSMRRAKS